MTKTQEEKDIGSLEHMVLSNSLTLVALVELLDEKGIIKTDELMQRMRRVRLKSKPE
jgi:hypothetical protein